MAGMALADLCQYFSMKPVYLIHNIKLRPIIVKQVIAKMSAFVIAQLIIHNRYDSFAG